MSFEATDVTERQKRRRQLARRWLLVAAVAVVASAGSATAVLVLNDSGDPQGASQVAAAPSSTPLSDAVGEAACNGVMTMQNLIIPQDWADEPEVQTWAQEWYDLAATARAARSPGIQNAARGIVLLVEDADGDLKIIAKALIAPPEPPILRLATECSEAGLVNKDQFADRILEIVGRR